MEVRSATGRRLLRDETQRRAAGMNATATSAALVITGCLCRTSLAIRSGVASSRQRLERRNGPCPLLRAKVDLYFRADAAFAGRRFARCWTLKGIGTRPANQVSQRRRSPPDLARQAGGRRQPSRRDAPMIGPEPPDRDPNSACKPEIRCANCHAGNVA
jgi:hypothetical protein